MCLLFRQAGAGLFATIPHVSYIEVRQNEYGGRSGFFMFLSALRFFFIILVTLGNCALPDKVFAAGNEEVGGRVQPVDAQLCHEMKLRGVLAGRGPLTCERLKLVNFSYIDFNNNIKADGRIIVLDAISQHVLNLFNELKTSHFPIDRAELMDVYNGNDDASMDNNNTSSFNDRNVAGSNTISLHAYGAAIDINPRQNPYIIRQGAAIVIKPAFGADYVQRFKPFPGMAEQAVSIFARHGFAIWGGEWTNPKDYQHFQLDRRLAERLVKLTAEQASDYFNKYVLAYRNCLSNKPGSKRYKLTRCRHEAGKLITE
jgi:hypothetical protein